MAKIFQCPVGQLVITTFMIAVNYTTGLQIVFSADLFEQGIDMLSLADIANDNRIGTTSRQIALAFITEQATVNSHPESFPVISFAAKLNIFPTVFFPGIIPGPRSIRATGHSFDVFVHFATTDIADFEILTELKNLLVKKTAVHTDNDWYVMPILFADSGNHMPDHLLDRVTMVGVLVAATKDRIDDQSAPVHLQRLKPFFLFIGRLDSMAAVGIIIVQNHGVNAQLNQLWLFYPQAPDKQRLQQSTKQKYSGPGKSVEKSFDPMRGGHPFHAGFDASGIPCVSLAS